MKRGKLSTLALIGVVSLTLLLTLFMLLGCAKAPEPTPTPAPKPTPSPTPAPSPKSEPIVLRCVTIGPPEESKMSGFNYFYDLVNERGKGELRIDWVGSGEIIPRFDQPKAVQSGVFDMTFTSGGYCEALVAVAGATFISELNPVEEREVGVYDYLLEHHQKAGLYYLGRDDSRVEFYLWTKDKVDTPYDLAGLRFRSSPFYENLLLAFGADPIVIPTPETYTALQRGLVDGTVYPMMDIVKQGWNEVLNYWIDHGFWTSAMVTLVNLDVWNRLPPHAQDLLIDCAIDTEIWCVEGYSRILGVEAANCEEVGMKPITFSPTDAEWYVDTAYRAAWADYEEKHPDLAPILKDLLSK